MCYANCCYKNVSLNRLRMLLLLFVTINILLSILAIFIRATKTERYKQVLKILDQRNNWNFTYYNLTNCRKGGTFKLDTYCKLDRKFVYKPSEFVSY